MTKAIDILNNQLLSDSFALRASGMTGFAYANSQQLLVREALQALHTSLDEQIDGIGGLGASHPHFANYISKNDVKAVLNDYFREEE